MRHFSSRAWFLVTIAAGAGPQLFRVHPVIALAAVGIAVWYVQAARGKIRALPVRLRQVLTVSTVGLVVACHRTLLGFEAGVAFLLLIAALKLHELRARRDYFILLWLASLLMLAEVIFSQNIASTAYSFAGLFLVLHSLMLLSSAADLDARAPSVWGGARRIAVAGLPIMLVLFAVFPRVQLNLLGALARGSSAMTGFNDELRPGEVAKLASSNEPAFRATFPEAVPPPMRDLYWRGAVLTATDGISWLRQRRIFEAPERTPRAGAVAHDIVLEPHANKWLFALDRPDMIVSVNERALEPRRLAGSIFEASRTLRARTIYRAYSRLEAGAPESDLSEEERARNLRLPRTLDPRIAELGRTLAAGGAEPEAVIARALDRFKDGFEYTMAPGESAPEKGIAGFLFETKKGFCEHFAAGLATMLRAAGVPARVIVGFHGGIMNPYGKYLTVRFQDAHAWVEAWVPGKGWTRTDPTRIVAPQRIEGGGQAFVGGLGASGIAGLRNLEPGQEVRGWRYFLAEAVFLADSINSQWNVFLVSYDFDYQRELIARYFPELPVWKAFGGAGVLAGVLIACVLFYVYRRRQAPRDRVVDAYRAMVARLARRGVKKYPSEGPLDFGKRAAHALPERNAEIHAAVSLFVNLRYGAGSQDSAKVSEFEKRARKVA